MGHRVVRLPRLCAAGADWRLGRCPRLVVVLLQAAWRDDGVSCVLAVGASAFPNIFLPSSSYLSFHPPSLLFFFQGHRVTPCLAHRSCGRRLSVLLVSRRGFPLPHAGRFLLRP